MIVPGSKKTPPKKVAGSFGDARHPISLFGGLYARIIIASLLMALVTISIVSSVFGLYLDRLSTSQADNRLSRSIAVLAPVIDGAVTTGNIQSARQILVNLVEEQGVICVDYTGPVADSSKPPMTIKLPQGGCQSFDELNTSFHEVQLMSSSAGAYRFYIDDRHFADDRNQQLFVTIITAAGALFVVILLLSFVIRILVLRPLGILQRAMTTSQPSKPILAEIVREDEIGAVSRTYNKLAASSRIYFARLERSQKKLQESEGKFKDMAEISGDWFYEMDADLRFTYISDRFFEILAIAPDDVIGKTRTEMGMGAEMGIGAVPSPLWQAHLDDLAARRPFKNFEYGVVGQHAEPVILRINGKPLFDETGDFIGYRGTGTDVSAITRDKQLLEETNRNFGESVSYASAIQRRLLPKKEKIEELFGQMSVVWQPKDLVGGDFYWVGQIGGARYLVFFDCTGHGVPGAFMTLITTSVLDTISAASPFALPAPQMLEQIHRGVAAQLGVTKGKRGGDGLDCAVIKLDISEGRLEFAGASIDLFITNRDGAVTRVRGARHSLGYQIFDEARQFESHYHLLAGNSFTLITDGLSTQIGEVTKRVLGTRRIIEALEAVGDNHPGKLVRSLGLLLKRWQGSEERRDDVTIVTFRPHDD